MQSINANFFLFLCGFEQHASGNLAHFKTSKSVLEVNKQCMEAYRDVIFNLLNEFDQRFKDIELLEKDFAFFSAPFTINLKILN